MLAWPSILSTPIRTPTHAARLPTYRWSLSEKYTSLGLTLLHQQCWHFGCDIKRSQGNLLLEAGFERTRPPAHLNAGSQYRLSLGEGTQITLWGFGTLIHHPQDGTLFLNRYRFSPTLLQSVPAGPVFQPLDLPRGHSPRSPRDLAIARVLLPRLFNWFASYESHVMELCGIAYRRSILAAWEHARVDPLRVVESWHRLANACQRRHHEVSTIHSRLIGI